MAGTPEVSVVIPTRDRPERIVRQLAALRRQTLAPERYEVIVVDDGSGEEARRLVDAEAARPGGPEVRVIHRDAAGGPGAARNSGWRLARAPLVAFTDDDCEAPPGWLEGYLQAARTHRDAFFQGKVLPLPEEEPSFGPFSHTVRVERLTRGFETANMLYPRALLERLGGFDEALTKSGEDMDLAWRAKAAGFEPVFVPEALTYHAVVQLGPLGRLRRAARWDEAPLVFRRHPASRRTLVWRLFWSREHRIAVFALLALALPARLWWLRWWLAAPYVTRLVDRRSGPLLAPYIIVHDALEIATLVRGSIRHRSLVI